MPEDDLGRDVASVEALQRKHERFESEISALGSQVDTWFTPVRVCSVFLL